MIENKESNVSICQKVGYVALLGSPNAGKSTLMNACVGTKISVVSNKPQTTRDKILGICNHQENQILFLDTPGIHDAKKLPTMNKYMNKLAWSVLDDADVICYLIDASRPWAKEDALWIENLLKKSSKVIQPIASKIDIVKKDILAENVQTIVSGIQEVCQNIGQTKAKLQDLIQVSAKRPHEVKHFCDEISEHLPHGTWLYGKDDLTDRSQYFICSEIIREQVFRQLGNELPYQMAVRVTKYEQKNTLIKLSADILVEKDSHKSIVIGKAGQKIKSIGMEARIALEKHLDSKVFLELFVQVKKGWSENIEMLSDLNHIL